MNICACVRDQDGAFCVETWKVLLTENLSVIRSIGELVERRAQAQANGAAPFLVRGQQVKVRGVGVAAPAAHPKDANAWPADAPVSIAEAFDQCRVVSFGGVELQVLAIKHFGGPSMCAQALASLPKAFLLRRKKGTSIKNGKLYSKAFWGGVSCKSM